jgi:hypothetical protein
VCTALPKGVEDRGYFLVHMRLVPPDVAHRQHDKFRERTGTIHPDARGERAKMAAAGKAVAAAPAGDVALAADDVAGVKVVHVGADFDNLADKLMPDHHWYRDGLLRPLVPVVDMDIGPADACVAHADQHVVDAVLRFGNILQPQTALAAALRQCLHHSPSPRRMSAEPHSLTCSDGSPLQIAKWS